MALDLKYSIQKLWKPKITRIKQMWAQPCQINPLIWVAGYFAASPAIAFALLQPDCLDATYNRFRMGHKKARRGSVLLHDYAKPIYMPKTGTNQFVFPLGEWAQRVGYYFLILDATEQWIIHGTSFAYQWSGCEDPFQPKAYLDTDTIPLGLAGQSSFIVNVFKVKQATQLSAGPNGVGIPSGMDIGAGFFVNQVKDQFPPLQDCDYRARLIDVRQGRNGPWVEPGAYTGNKRGAGAFDLTRAGIDKPSFYAVEIEKGAGILYGQVVLSVSGSNLSGISKSACGHQPGKEG